MNIKFIHGRLTRDPELTRGSDQSHDRVNFTVATDRRFGDETDFHDCVMFGKRAAVIDKYFSKGSEIVLFGEDQQRNYTDRNGVKRTSWSIMVAEFEFCGSKKTVSEDTAKAIESIAREALNVPDSMEQAESDIPF